MSRSLRDIAILLLGLAISVLPWLLDRLNVVLPRLLLLLALLVSVIIIWFAPSSLGWIDLVPFFKGKSVSLSSAVLAFLAAVAFCCCLFLWHARTIALTEWQSTKQEKIYAVSFANQEVVVDGKIYDHCSFTNVTFMDHGSSPAEFVNSKLSGSTPPPT